MIGKRLINTGVAADAGITPSEHFNTVLYTGNGSTQRIGGYINRGAVFNGSSSVIPLPDSLQTYLQSYGTSFTFSCWLNTTTTSNGIVFTNSQGDVSPFYTFLLQVNSNGTVLAQKRVGSSNVAATSTGTVNDGNWHHIAIVLDSSNTTIFIDGSQDGQVSDGNAFNTFSSSTYRLGAGNANAGYNTLFNGKLDQVRIFDKALSSTEVTTLSNETHASTTISTTDIFNDNSGIALYQLDGNANDTGGVSGKFGSAAIFNGSSSKIFLTSTGTSITDYDSDFSVSMWVYMVNLPHAVSQDHLWTGGGTRIIPMSINTDGTVLIDFFNGSSNQLTSTNALTQNGWTHLVMTRSKTNGLKFYLDGSESGTSSYTGNAASLSQKDSIGSYWDGTRMSFDGKIDDVRIYSDVLTSTEIGYLYNNTTASIPTDNLTAYYKLDGDARDEQQLYDGTASNVTYAYDGTATNVTYQEATKFSPDLVWAKARSNSHPHVMFDSVRGENKQINPNETSAEITRTSGAYEFETNGFSVSTAGNSNNNNYTYVAWCFNAGEGAAVSNTDGTITSTVKANQDAGFSIVKYTSNGSYTSSDTIGHGLSQPCELVIWKPYESTASDWFVQYELIDGSVDYLILNEADAKRDSASTYAFQSNVLVNYAGANGQDTIAYCFHSVDNYQKVGSYTGTGSAGNSVVTGFEPAFVMVKRTDSTSGWLIIDNKRGSGHELYPHSSIAELSSAEGGVYDRLHLEGNGFTFTGSAFNESGSTWIYLAIAADPDTTTPTVENSFDVVTYTGDGGTQSIDTDFKPDLVWIKNRNNSSNSTHDHSLFDSIRGDFRVRSNSTGAQNNYSSHFGGINDNGFTVTSGLAFNDSSGDYVAWCWKAGDHDDNLPQINTEGSIDSVVSVNAEAGFSIVKYTGNGTSGTTVGHGLSQAPDLIFIKNIDKSANYHWTVYSNTPSTGATGLLYLNLTDGFTVTSSRFNNTTPTSSVVTLGNDGTVNESGDDHIAYCFHSVTGYQKVGSYTGNGSTSNTITTGFKPRFLLIKRTDVSGYNWNIMDSLRGDSDYLLSANTSSAEVTSETPLNTTSTGFVITISSNYINASGGTYIYLAIK